MLAEAAADVSHGPEFIKREKLAYTSTANKAESIRAFDGINVA